DQLTANGVAFVSFNTQPGGHIRQAVRDMMQYHLNRPLHDARSVREGKEFLKLLTGMTEEGTLWNKILCEETTRLDGRADSVIFRSFRRSLVCRKELNVDRRHFSGHLRRLYVASPLVQCDQKPDGSVSFKNERGPGTITASSHVIIGALRALQAAWPRAVHFT